MKARNMCAALALLVSAAARAQSPAKHMLFRVHGLAGATVYLLGSVHLLDSSGGTLPAVVDSAFLHAHTVVFETSLDSVMQRGMELVGLARYPTGKSIETEFPPATVAKLDSLFTRYGVSMAQVRQFKPWFISLLLDQMVMQGAGFQGQYGVDAQLNARAKRDGKTVVGLEPVEFQIHLFDSLTPADQATMLLESVSPDSAINELKTIRNAWVAGDTARLNNVLNAPARESPTMFATLVLNRTRSWLPRIESMLRGHDDVLVVVGAGHLVGHDGLIELLERDGYRVEQM